MAMDPDLKKLRRLLRKKAKRKQRLITLRKEYNQLKLEIRQTEKLLEEKNNGNAERQ